MKIEMDEKGNLLVNVYRLIEEMTPEQKKCAVDALAMDHDIMEEVVNMIVDGYTSDGSYIGHSQFDDIEPPHNPLEKARKRMVDQAPKEAQDVIEELCRRVRWLDVDLDNLNRWTWQFKERISDLCRRLDIMEDYYVVNKNLPEPRHSYDHTEESGYEVVVRRKSDGKEIVCNGHLTTDQTCVKIEGQ